MPEHLRAALVAASVGLGGISLLLGGGRPSVHALDSSPIPQLRQYVRVFRSLVLFAEQELPSTSVLVPATAMTSLQTEVLVIGSGAGGSTTAARLAAAGRTVTIVEEGPWVDPDARRAVLARGDGREVPPRGSCAALGRPAIAYAEGRCVGGSTEINSGLYHRLPPELAEEWQPDVPHRRVHRASARPLRRAGRRGARRLAPARRAAAVVGRARAGRDQARLARGRVLAGVPLRPAGPRREADDGAHDAPAARSTPAPRVIADCRVIKLVRRGDRVDRRAVRAHPPRRHRPSASRSTPTTSSCAAARSRRPRCCSAAASAATSATA